MIDTYLPLINARLNNVRPLGLTSHFPGKIVESIEQMFLTDDLNEGRLHPSHPLDRVERETKGRKMVYPMKASYLNMDLRIGRVMLHVKERNSTQNLEAIAMAYVGERKDLKFKDSKTKMVRSAACTVVMLLNNGVVSAYYAVGNFPIAHVTSWHPDPGRRPDYGWPYPESDVDVKNMLEQATSHSGIFTETKAYKAYPHLVMLAVDTHRKAS